MSRLIKGLFVELILKRTVTYLVPITGIELCGRRGQVTKGETQECGPDKPKSVVPRSPRAWPTQERGPKKPKSVADPRAWSQEAQERGKVSKPKSAAEFRSPRARQKLDTKLFERTVSTNLRHIYLEWKLISKFSLTCTAIQINWKLTV